MYQLNKSDKWYSEAEKKESVYEDVSAGIDIKFIKEEVEKEKVDEEVGVKDLSTVKTGVSDNEYRRVNQESK